MGLIFVAKPLSRYESMIMLYTNIKIKISGIVNACMLKIDSMSCTCDSLEVYS